MDTDGFARDAFSRNLGLISEEGQEKLLRSRVAVAGAGGVGGLHLLTLARLGIGNFTVADFDTFDVVNISRQFGALVSTLGKPKAGVLADMVRDINPSADVRLFHEGVTPENMDSFLEGADLFIDGIDFFSLDVRRLVFRRCREKGIPALTSAPLGFGATLQIFTPDGMTFDDYFGFSDRMTRLEQIAAFAAGLAPRPYHIRYLDLSRVNLQKQTGPAVAPACTLAASLVATEAVKLLTGRGTVRPAPCYLQFDMMRGKFHLGMLRFGGRGPIQILKRKLILRKALAAMEE
ncbi:MAG: thiamine biosynthesis protein ThiF [Geobacteraceae bacterium]|nr:thiamine biosynthesis protein ThiF [Geobacteraceae bacterium]